MNLADKRENLTDDEINQASKTELCEAMIAIENDFYRGLDICQKDIIRRWREFGVFDRDDAIVVLKAHRQWWMEKPERERKADEQYYASIIFQYGHLSIDALEQKLSELDSTINGFSRTAKREFSGNGNRRTSAAVAAEGVRDVGEHKMRLSSYIQWRKEMENK